MKKPIILVTGGPALDPVYRLESRMLNKPYSYAIQSAGGIPVMDLDNEAQDDYVALADGVLFSGTQGFQPDPSLSLAEYQKERKQREQELMRKFIRSGKPVLGICQGMQQLNVALGGDLYVDFKFDLGVEHDQTYHPIRTEEGSLLHRMFGKEFRVNSFHNVKIKTLAPDLKATAFSPDGVIEAFEHRTLPVYGFQWHPERMRGDFHDTPGAPDVSELFRFFVDLCAEPEV